MKIKNLLIILLTFGLIFPSNAMENEVSINLTPETKTALKKLDDLVKNLNISKIVIPTLGLTGFAAYYIYSRLKKTEVEPVSRENSNKESTQVQESIQDFLDAVQNKISCLVLNLKFDDIQDIDNFSSQELFLAFIKSLNNDQLVLYSFLEKALIENFNLLKERSIIDSLKVINHPLNKSQISVLTKSIEKFDKEDFDKILKYKDISNKFKDLDVNSLFTEFLKTLSRDQWSMHEISENLEKIAQDFTLLFEDEFSDFIKTLDCEQVAIKDLLINKFVLEDIYKKLNK